MTRSSQSLESPEIPGRFIEALMLGRPLDGQQKSILGKAAAEKGAALGFRVAAGALEAGPPTSQWWGWKEPNSHLVLPELIEAFPKLVYVHVLRHPLDMAFSHKRDQTKLWGPTFGIDIPEQEEAWPEAQLRWWIRSTEMAMEAGHHLGDRFMLFSLEEFCARPADILSDLCRRGGIDAPSGDIEEAVTHVETPSSAGRWRECEWQQLPTFLLEKASAYGFEIPAEGA